MPNQLDKNFLAKAKQKLLEKKEEVKKLLLVIAQKQSDQDYQAKFPDYGRAEEENADEVASYDNALAMERNLENTLNQINIAIDKINKKTYSVCDDCEKKISQKRLLASPMVNLCLKCQEKEG